MNYELDWSYLPRAERGSNIALVGVFTGLPEADIRLARKEVCRVHKKPNCELWGGQAFVHIFRLLGFNTDDRFIKFDPHTDKPCIMRCGCESWGTRWWATVYYDGKVNNHWTLEEFKKGYTDMKITSMLRVWL